MTISIRHAPATGKNPELKEVPAKAGETNLDWLKRAAGEGGAAGAVVLLGGSDLEHFRVRCAQSRLRSDMLPSFWSLAGILVSDRAFVSVPLDFGGDVSGVPQTNGVTRCRLSDYADPKWFPNIAVINFTDSAKTIASNVERIEHQRSVIDLPSHIVPWLAYVWGTGTGENPLVGGFGLPSAAFVETVFGLAGIELTPGLSSASSCPEAIWSTASWWQDFYEAITEAEDRAQEAIPAAADLKEGAAAKSSGKKARAKAAVKAATSSEGVADTRRARARIPTGFYAIRQPAAYVEE